MLAIFILYQLILEKLEKMNECFVTYKFTAWDKIFAHCFKFNVRCLAKNETETTKLEFSTCIINSLYLKLIIVSEMERPFVLLLKLCIMMELIINSGVIMYALFVSSRILNLTVMQNQKGHYCFYSLGNGSSKM